jgi:hypothetical protein
LKLAMLRIVCYDSRTALRLPRLRWLMGSKIKAQLRKTKARTKQFLDDAIAEAFSLVSPADISGWLVKDGYSI